MDPSHQPGGSDSRGWEVLERRPVYGALPYLQVLQERVRLPDGRVVEDFHQVTMRDFALVVAQDEQGRVILIRQYKHGPRRVGLHVPGGYLAEGEDPAATARRELLEETGYASEQWRSLGSYTCNANQGCGRAHLFAAAQARPVTCPDPGDLEEMEVVFLDRAALVAALASGQVHTIDNLAALLLALNPLTS